MRLQSGFSMLNTRDSLLIPLLLFPLNLDQIIFHREFALVSGTDKTFREDTKRTENVDELPKLIGQLSNNATTLPTSSRGVINPEEGEEAAEENSSAVEVDDSIFVRVTRPSGPTYTVIDLPGG